MSKRNKLQRFADLLSFPNVYENNDGRSAMLAGAFGAEKELAGKWNEEHFQKEAPLILELGCGYGEYSVALARLFPDKNIIGIDCKGSRLWKGASIGLEENLKNLAFLRTRIEMISFFFGKNEVSEIWITFPDPFLENYRINRRLTSPAFLEKYREMLKPDGIIHLKTDESTLYQYSLDILSKEKDAKVIIANDDIYAAELPNPLLTTKTRYENKFLGEGKAIKYIQFTL
jgi:tRNA (guanine-N7-)-methyltransferase